MKYRFEKKIILAIFVISISFIFLSCKIDENILGEWQHNSVRKTEILSEPENLDSLIAFVYFQNSIIFTFSDDGTFTKKVFQKIEKIEYIDENPENKISLPNDDIFYVAEGKFKTANGKIHLKLKSVTIKDGDGEIFFSADEIKSFEFSVEDLIQNFPYNKLEDSELFMWDFEINSFVKFKNALSTM